MTPCTLLTMNAVAKGSPSCLLARVRACVRVYLYGGARGVLVLCAREYCMLDGRRRAARARGAFGAVSLLHSRYSPNAKWKTTVWKARTQHINTLSRPRTSTIHI